MAPECHRPGLEVPPGAAAGTGKLVSLCAHSHAPDSDPLEDTHTTPSNPATTPQPKPPTLGPGGRATQPEVSSQPFSCKWFCARCLEPCTKAAPLGSSPPPQLPPTPDPWEAREPPAEAGLFPTFLLGMSE